jgi:hypothetical protein
MTAAHNPTTAPAAYFFTSAAARLPTLGSRLFWLSVLSLREQTGTASGSTAPSGSATAARASSAHQTMVTAHVRSGRPHAARSSHHGACESPVDHATGVLPADVGRRPPCAVGGVPADSIARWSLRSTAFPSGGAKGKGGASGQWTRGTRPRHPPAGPGGSAGRRRPASGPGRVSAAGGCGASMPPRPRSSGGGNPCPPYHAFIS